MELSFHTKQIASKDTRHKNSYIAKIVECSTGDNTK